MRYLTIVAFVTLAFVSCKKEEDDSSSAAFDKGAMLTNIADNTILPALADYQAKVTELKSAFDAFETDASSANFDLLREKWQAAYLAYQTVKMYDFGPFRNYGYKGATGTFPTDTAVVESNISSGTYNLASAGNTVAIGFSALDYLLYNPDAFTRLSETGYKTYTKDVIYKLSDETTAVVSAWSSYRSTFVSSTGTETTSSFSELVNEFNRDYELAKTAKLGIPIGIQSFGIQLPEYIEAPYSGISLDLLRANIASIHRLYKGKSHNGSSNGSGFDDYLIHLEKSALNTTINNTFDQIITKIDTFQGTLEEEMQSNPSELEALYNLIQSQVVNLKTDMTSSFGVLITYQDNDGD